MINQKIFDAHEFFGKHIALERLVTVRSIHNDNVVTISKCACGIYLFISTVDTNHPIIGTTLKDSFIKSIVPLMHNTDKDDFINEMTRVGYELNKADNESDWEAVYEKTYTEKPTTGS